MLLEFYLDRLHPPSSVLGLGHHPLVGPRNPSVPPSSAFWQSGAHYVGSEQSVPATRSSLIQAGASASTGLFYAQGPLQTLG